MLTISMLFSRRILLFFCSLIATTALFATSRTFVGPSTGDWGEATNWSPVGVPGVSDEAIIPSGAYARILPNDTYSVNRVIVETSGRLYNSGLLILDDENPTMNVSGLAWNYGQGEIRFAGQDGPGTHGLTVQSSGWLYNQGQLTVRNNARIILTNGGKFFNPGTIDANYDNLGYVNPIYAGSGGSLYNYTSGNILISNTISSAFFIDYGGYFSQYGTVIIEDCNSGLTCYENCLNRGTLSVYGSSYTALEIKEGKFTNRGIIEVIDPDGGDGIQVKNGGKLENWTTGEITLSGDHFNVALSATNGGSTVSNEGSITIQDYSAGNRSLSLFFFAEFDNDGGLLSVSSNKDHAIYLEAATLRNHDDGFIGAGGAQSGTNSIFAQNFASGTPHPSTIQNEDCGLIYLTSALNLEGNTTLTNEAWFDLNDSGANSSVGPNCTFTNEGVLEDFYEVTTPFNINNTAGIIIQPIYGNVTPNVPYYDPIDLGPATAVVVSEEMYGGLPSLLRGTYNQANNYWVSDNNYSNFYLEFTLPGGCDSRKLNIYRYPYSPITQQQDELLELGDINHSPSEELSVYPNPAASELNVSLPSNFRGQLQVRLQSLSGQTILQRSIEGNSGQFSVERPVGLPAGTYLLTVVSTKGEIENKRVVFQ